jgi:L-histidine Nalpha-methyltransferase
MGSQSPVSTVDLHPSAAPERLQLADALRAGRLDSRMLYATPRQAELWSEVARRHSPVYTRPGFARVYESAFARLELPPGGLTLVGVGCGTGEKEAQLFRHLAAIGRAPAQFAAIDVSAALVRASAARLAEAGAASGRHLVFDLNETAHLSSWLGEHAPGPRLLTFFGLIPNFAPGTLGRILRALLRAQDVLLVSVHLVPGSMREILPQYDNPETLAWLTAALETHGLREFLSDPTIIIGEVENIPAFLGQATWLRAEKIADNFVSIPGQPFVLFQSLRYAPRQFEDWLSENSFLGKHLASTSCGEEGIWSVCLPD